MSPMPEKLCVRYSSVSYTHLDVYKRQAYSILNDLRFEWDDEDEMTIEKLCDIIQKLGNYFDFDPEQVEQITGLKVLGIKNNFAPLPGPDEASKKKVAT